ncbi:A/G-specific adenine glycosylase [Mangrovitalea sediminis]|uniref:A/G-specific adenine glycosylase n=1 Tax=Mangrovitalea sediminis TaxID=1982043 RepID=UPI000BE5B0DB|nr:A/G-specific adenine glycosylase [Mangrovitalea sediminis]
MTTFADKLLSWYDQHGRQDLPWHQDRSAYRVWISEIMLQQTQVATVIPYFERFMQRFPDVATLADAPLDDVLEHWSGLGYYARARNLHKAAKQVSEQFGGAFPEDIEALESLPGIGRSTAGAILAQAFQQRASILDGNVKRVLARHHAIAGWPGQTDVLRQLWDKAETHTPDHRVRDYTQAIMDLGALLCTRSKPDCQQCPINDSCAAFQRGTPTEYPGRKPRKTLPEKATWMLMIEDGEGRLLFERRPPSGIWGGLWSLPEADPALNTEELADYCANHLGLDCQPAEPRAGLRHTFSHYHLQIQPALLRCLGTRAVADSDRRWHFRDDAVRAGIPAPIRKLLTEPAQLDLAPAP